jgi:hypothetical protein
MKIVIETIPHHEQRYETVGDWVVDRDTKTFTIRVSELDNWKYELLVGLHELIEVALCVDRGISSELVDQFDFAYESARSVDDNSEPGDATGCPYGREHYFATNLERLMAAELKVDWNDYDEELSHLGG